MMEHSEVIEATLPLSPENQVKYFKDKSVLFRINVSESRITPRQCLMTLSNMRLKVEVADVSPEILHSFMTDRFIVETTNLAKIAANVILGYRYASLPYADVEPNFSIDQYAEFIEEHQDMIAKWCEVIAAVPMYLLFCSQGFVDDEALESLKKSVPHVEGSVDGVGVNLSQVVALPEFLTLFFDEELIRESLTFAYYEHYFDEYIYSGKKLLSYLASDSHQSDFAIDSLALMQCFSEGQVTQSGGEQSD